jgi:DNA polymerase-3 subunit epsilon
LKEAFKVYRMDYPNYAFFDTLATARRHFHGTLPNHQLQTVAAACGYDLTRHHHALADAEACAAIALKIL